MYFDVYRTFIACIHCTSYHMYILVSFQDKEAGVFEALKPLLGWSPYPFDRNEAVSFYLERMRGQETGAQGPLCTDSIGHIRRCRPPFRHRMHQLRFRIIRPVHRQLAACPPCAVVPGHP
jgi:hypothetical protein